MAGRRENAVMRAVYELCDGCESCLVSGADILSLLPKSAKCNVDILDDVLLSLHSDGYLDIITSERKGEKMYVITLKENGVAFKRAQRKKQQDVYYKILLAFVGAFATFIFGLILNALFG